MLRRHFLASTAIPFAQAQTPRRNPPALPEILRPPDSVTFHGGSEHGIEVTAVPRGAELPVTVNAPNAEVEHICLRWRAALPDSCRYLGDHWERSYGDLEWRGSVPERPMPWYFVAFDGRNSRGYGVKTGAASICFWQADPDGVSLWLDLRNGGSPVRLGDRQLLAATVVSPRAEAGKPPFQVARDLCRAMCSAPRLPAAPAYGGNNWYYTYGENFTAADILRDSETLSSLAPAAERNRPFSVIDMGWSPAPSGAGPLEHGTAAFPDMPRLARQIVSAGARPGIWIRPLLTTESLPEGWHLASHQVRGPQWILDPSVPEALDHIRQSVRRVRGWGYDLIKHDYSTYDIFGRWGFQMGPTLTNRGWHFADRSRTTAEIVRALYGALRDAAGDAVIIGCNTIGHLGAGLFEVQRIGDDTSGREWERTRKMGINTLAFRLPQHNTLFAADPDCVAVTPAVPWDKTKLWLDLVARSGTALFVSLDPAALGDAQRSALKEAFAIAARPQSQAEPLDWMETTAPERWRFGTKEAHYDWYGSTGASPFAG